MHCYMCKATYSTVVEMKAHLATHTSDITKWKPYGCPFEGCLKAFYSATDICRHFTTHTGARPFKCMACDAVFSRKTSLQRHTKSFHGDLLDRNQEPPNQQGMYF